MKLSPNHLIAGPECRPYAVSRRKEVEMANKFWTLTGIVVLALVFGAGAAIAQTTGEREHAGGQADETEGQQGAKDNAGKIAQTTGEREHAGGQADETEGQQGAKDNAGKANKQGKSKNNGKAGKQGQGGAANNPGANGGGTAGTGGGATPK
jgi:hypothetical protein